MPCKIFILSILCLLLTTPLSAQKVQLQGKITDAETGEGLPGANIVIKSGQVHTGTASLSSGNFEINLPAGVYEISVSFIGYETQKFSDFDLSVSGANPLNVKLKPTGIMLNPVSVSASRRPEKTLEAPASISVLDAKDLMQEIAPSSAALLKNVTGLDMATTGIDRQEIVLRGFGNVFSGATYILTDYRRAAVPSLDVNLHSIMPNIAIDLAKVEIVRGPGSALYGAGVDAGVIHYFTKDPFEYPGTSVAFSGGERSSFAGYFRHANSFNNKFGYKITGQYAQADDWTLNPNDSIDAAQLRLDLPGLSRNTDYEKLNLNGLLQYRLSDKTTLTASGGFSTLDATVLSAISTVQADNFGYRYGQLRLQAGKFFAQAYLNKNDAGDSFIYGTGDRVVDNSTLLNLQAQYDLDFYNEKEQVIIGVDYDRTNPDTKHTIFGRNEEHDLMSEFGIYTQSTTRVSPKLDAIFALRSDINNIENDLQISPRAAFVYKPSPKHSLRATYNRAYDSPGSTSLFLDIVAQEDSLAPGMVVKQRGRGAINSFTFNAATSGDVIRASGLLPVNSIFGQELIYNAANQPTANINMSDIYSAIYAQLANFETAEIQALLAANGVELDEQAIELFLQLLSPDNLNIQGKANTEIEFAPIDSRPLKSTITHSFELGYKGLLGTKILFAVDAYYSMKKNFVSGNTQITPRALYSNFEGEFTPALANGLNDNAFLAFVLNSAGLPPDSLASFITDLAVAGGIKDLGVGVVQPDQNMVPGEILGAYRNFGNVDFWGIDASFQYLHSTRLSFFGNASFVSDDFFDDKELDEPGTGLQVALNAPSFKWKAGFSYSVPKGISVNSSVRFTKGFPVLSGPFVGNVEDYFLWDVGAGYDLSGFVSGMQLDFTVQNVLNNEHREFIGAPQIGRLALARLSYTLP